MFCPGLRSNERFGSFGAIEQAEAFAEDAPARVDGAERSVAR
jgi:hypothetical protein